MILIMMPNNINEKAAEILRASSEEKVRYFDELEDSIDLSASSDKSLTLIDLIADGRFQSSYSPEALAEFLKGKGLIRSSIQRIYLLISDVDVEHPLIYFASLLVREIGVLGKNLEVCVCADINFDASIITPPKEDGLWKVHHIKNLGLELEQPFSYEKISSSKTKKLAWQGNNIYEFLEQPKQIFDEKRVYVPSESEVEDLKASSEIILSHSSPIFYKPELKKEAKNSEENKNVSSKRKQELPTSSKDIAELLHYCIERPEFTDILLELSEESFEKLKNQIEASRETRKKTCIR